MMKSSMGFFSTFLATVWTYHGAVDKLETQIEARSNASGLTPP